MTSKLTAARICTTAGENVILAHGRTPRVLERITNGELIGTAFLAEGKSVSPWKRWIGFSAPSTGSIVLDQGACDAVIGQGRSLLAIGIREVRGEFEKGDVIAIADPEGRERARGLTNYASDQLRQIIGLHSHEIAQTLGQCPYEEVIHRDNMTVTRS
jgi:glutamate 5-kinase